MKLGTFARIPVLMAVTLLPAAAASAADAPAPGTRVRVVAADSGRFTGTITGTLVRIGDGSLTILGKDGSSLALPAESVTRIEVSEGVQRKTRKGMFIGAAAGIVLGLAAYEAAKEDDAYGCGLSYAYKKCTRGDQVKFAAMGAAFYGGVGAWFGHRKKTERWRDAPLDRVSVRVTPQDKGARADLRFAF